ELELRQVEREIKNHVDGFFLSAVVIKAVHISLQLAAVTDDLMSALLKGKLHVFPWRVPDISPEGHLLSVLLDYGNVFGTHSPTLGVRHVLFTHCFSELLSTLSHQRGTLRLPESICYGPCRNGLGSSGPRFASRPISTNNTLQLFTVAH